MIDREYVEESDRLMGMDSAMPPVKAGADAGDDDPHEFAGALEGNDPIVLAANDGVSARTKQGFKEAGLDADGGYGGSGAKQASPSETPTVKHTSSYDSEDAARKRRQLEESARRSGIDPKNKTDDQINKEMLRKMMTK